MLYLGIDLHRKQMTVSLRNQSGDILLRRQVSTRWPQNGGVSQTNCSRPWLPTRNMWRWLKFVDFMTGW